MPTFIIIGDGPRLFENNRKTWSVPYRPLLFIEKRGPSPIILMAARILNQLRMEIRMLHDERVTYDTIKAWLLETYFDFCRDKGVIKHWPREEILAAVSGQFDVTFERPIEELMQLVVYLVLCGGQHVETESKLRKIITDQLLKYNLDNLLADVPEEEAEFFKHDLTILKLI